MENKIITLANDCPFCGKYQEVEVRLEDYFRWNKGELVQNAFPYLTPNEREIIISGICPKCWDETFRGE